MGEVALLFQSFLCKTEGSLLSSLRSITNRDHVFYGVEVHELFVQGKAGDTALAESRAARF